MHSNKAESDNSDIDSQKNVKNRRARFREMLKEFAEDARQIREGTFKGPQYEVETLGALRILRKNTDEAF